MSEYQLSCNSESMVWRLTCRSVRTLLKNKQRVGIRVASGSMLPTLQIGQHVMVEPLCRYNARLGDIVLRQQKNDEYLMIHRCIMKLRWMGKLYYVTKADACFEIDDVVTSDKVFGVVRSCVTDIGWRSLWFRYGQVLFLPIFMLARLFCKIIFGKRAFIKW